MMMMVVVVVSKRFEAEHPFYYNIQAFPKARLKTYSDGGFCRMTFTSFTFNPR